MNDIHVVLVNEQDESIGTAEKIYAHEQGLLHRAFSVYILNPQNEMLLQKRVLTKYHAGGLWTNTCCGHPLPDEDIWQAARRRLEEEMGFSCALEKLFELRYCTPVGNGLTENEYLHVFSGVYNGTVQADPAEAEDYHFLPIAEIVQSVNQFPENYTPWFRLVLPRVVVMKNS